MSGWTGFAPLTLAERAGLFKANGVEAETKFIPQRERNLALANGPEILLPDEPFGALDHQTRELMQELLLEIWQADRKIVLFVTHDIDEAIFLTNRVVVMSARPGRIKAEVAVPLAYPREWTVKTSPEFAALKARLMAEIREEVRRAAVG